MKLFVASMKYVKNQIKNIKVLGGVSTTKISKTWVGKYSKNIKGLDGVRAAILLKSHCYF